VEVSWHHSTKGAGAGPLSWYTLFITSAYKQATYKQQLNPTHIHIHTFTFTQTMQRRAVTRTVALVSRPQQATMMLGARRLNTNSTSTGPVSTLNTLIETTKDSKEGTHWTSEIALPFHLPRP
jgi:hypothetical protein